MKNILTIILSFLFSSGVFAECSGEIREEQNACYLEYLTSCSDKKIKHYANDKIDVFESTNLNLDCLEKQFTKHLQNPVTGSLDIKIIHKREVIKKPIAFDMIEIPSLFSEDCDPQSCEPSNEIILISNGQYWFVKSVKNVFNLGIKSKFIRKDTIHISNTTCGHHTFSCGESNSFFDTKTKVFTSLPHGRLEFKNDHLLIHSILGFFNDVNLMDGNFHYSIKTDLKGEFIELVVDSGETCESLERFDEDIQDKMKKQGLQKFCVITNP